MLRDRRPHGNFNGWSRVVLQARDHGTVVSAIFMG